MKLGRRKSDAGRYARMITLKLKALPTVPKSADHLKSIPTWVLGGNNVFGTCGPVSVANYLTMIYKDLLGEDIVVPNSSVYDLYRRSGNPSFDPTAPVDPETGTVPGDDGVDMTVMLDALLKGGMKIRRANGSVETATPICYAKLDIDLATQYAATAILGGVLWGVDLKVAQQSQTDAGLWSYKQSADWGGHAIMGGAYTGKVTGSDVAIITWANRVGTTDAFAKHQLAEAYVPIFKPQWDHPSFVAGVDQAALAADYKAITGRDFPLPVPPTPPSNHLRITLDIDPATGKAVQV